jgi:hypothetical protein
MTLDGTMSKVLEHVGASMSKEEVIAEIIECMLDGGELDDLRHWAEAHLEQMYEEYTKLQLREEMEMYGYEEMLEATKLWEHEKEG